jgi:addiction module HigA family antidote
MKSKLAPIHPGEHIRQGLEDLGISAAEAARLIDCSRAFMGDLIHGKRNMSVEMCFKISGLLGSTPEFWATLQRNYDIETAERNSTLMKTVRKIQREVKEFEQAHA